jgi:hypothetical protein
MLETNTIDAAAAVAEGMVKRLLPRSADARVVYLVRDERDGLGRAAERSDVCVRGVGEAAVNMLAACQHVEDGPRGVKVWAFNPGYVATGLSRTGEKGRQGGGIGGRGMRGECEAVVDIVLGRGMGTWGGSFIRIVEEVEWYGIVCICTGQCSPSIHLYS